MEDRMNKIEQKLTRIEVNVEKVVDTLKGFNDLKIETKVLEQKVALMDKELIESFERINNKIDKSIRDRDWLIKIILTAVVVGMLNLLIHPFSEG